MAEMKGNEVFDGRATVKLNRPMAGRTQGGSVEAKTGGGKVLFLVIAVAVVALVFFLK